MRECRRGMSWSRLGQDASTQCGKRRQDERLQRDSSLRGRAFRFAKRGTAGPPLRMTGGLRGWCVSADSGRECGTRRVPGSAHRRGRAPGGPAAVRPTTRRRHPERNGRRFLVRLGVGGAGDGAAFADRRVSGAGDDRGEKPHPENRRVRHPPSIGVILSGMAGGSSVCEAERPAMESKDLSSFFRRGAESEEKTHPEGGAITNVAKWPAFG